MTSRNEQQQPEPFSSALSALHLQQLGVEQGFQGWGGWALPQYGEAALSEQQAQPLFGAAGAGEQQQFGEAAVSEQQQPGGAALLSEQEQQSGSSAEVSEHSGGSDDDDMALRSARKSNPGDRDVTILGDFDADCVGTPTR